MYPYSKLDSNYHDFLFYILSDFTCVSGVKSYANGRLMSDTSEFETCQDRGYGSAPRECYQVSMETTMNANGFQGNQKCFKSSNII